MARPVAAPRGGVGTRASTTVSDDGGAGAHDLIATALGLTSRAGGP